MPEKVRFDGRAFRRSLGKTGRYIRNPVNDKDSLALMEAHGVGYSTTGLVAQMRENGNTWQYKGLTIKLAKSYGYCWGVERAVQMAYEARRAYPGQKLYVTNEIIHNPAVNQVGKTSHAGELHMNDLKSFAIMPSAELVVQCMEQDTQECMVLLHNCSALNVL